ncbi:proline-rich transmembrane protein 3 [Microcaecilia unicolor]|uniref:Proline-rich transmembrane protein 3 n=1 Tax=Microcaecilia unicolor TaxID=1415580 RepID=A0A6P7YCV1_9AMPH|nr:proline-rich transmembrane protein 3 [Microcaecilia unicolor]XP_030062879.1 proline-rich transmembrane protein 3 [Microcaecilia unicolor]XP_030062880.1 proline-rich transmembrane protein 3 [Microcaecilia unicolor]XP_030062881.1 proline-rich transmembrane protein 3 [Microcaecilia unicolor]
MMAGPMQILVWGLLLRLVTAGSSLIYELNSITGNDLRYGFSEENSVRHDSKEILNNWLDVQESPGLKREDMLALSNFESVSSRVAKLRNYGGSEHSTATSSLLNFQQRTLETTPRPVEFPTTMRSDLGHQVRADPGLRTYTTPLSIKPENASQTTVTSLKKKPDPVETAEDIKPLTDVLPKYNMIKLSNEFQYTTKPWVETLISISPPTLQDETSSDTERKLLHSNSHIKEDRKLKTDNGRSTFHTLAMSSRVESDLAVVAKMESNMARTASSTESKVSTLTIGGNPESSTVKGLQIEGGKKDVDQTILGDSVDIKDDFADFHSNIVPSSQTQTIEPNVMIPAGQVENNFIDDFLPRDEEEIHLPVSDKHLASYRTTESYFTLRDKQDNQNAPIWDTRVTAYANDMVELLQQASKEEAQSSTMKDNVLISERSRASKDNMRVPHFSAFSQSKLTTTVVSMSNHRPTSLSGNVLQMSMSTEAPKQDYSTRLTSFTKENRPDSFSAFLSHGMVLDSKSKTWTETHLAHQISTRKAPISTSAKDVKMIEEVSPTPTLSVKEGEKKVKMTTEFFLYLGHKTPTPRTQKSFMHPDKTSLQALTKGTLKVEDLEQSSAQSALGVGGSVVTHKISTTTGASASGSFTPVTWSTSVTRQLDPTDRSVKLNSITQQSPGTSSSQISSSTGTGRRGQIKVTTQRALQRPRLVVASTSNPSTVPSSSSPCVKNNGACKYLLSNQTLLQWEDMQRTLSFAWELHVYGSGVLFVILSLICVVNLIGSPILHIYNLPYIMLSNALLFVVGLLRAVFFFTDPYGTKSIFSHRVILVLYNITFPLMITTFGILILLMLKVARLKILPPRLQSLPLLAMVGVIHFVILLSSDLFAHILNPSVNVILHVLSASWGTFLMVGSFVAHFKLRKNMENILSQAQRVSSSCEDTLDMHTQGRNPKCLFTSFRVLLVCSISGLLCCVLQVYAVLWLFGILGRTNEFSWSWWFLQFWFRIFELVLCFGLVFIASHIFCQWCGSNEHTCWSKILRYLCTYNKTEVPEYPNNCYDWSNGLQDRVANNDISKSLIRNQSENVPLKALKDNNEINANVPFFNKSESSSSPIVKPRLGAMFNPKSQNVVMGRSYTSICFEKDSVLSLMDLEFRPPSPINLSRSIDEALFREHLVRDSIFNDSSLQYPSYLSRQDSCSSLKENSVFNQTVDPLLSSDLKLRRNSNPDYMYSLARCSSATSINSPSVSLQHAKYPADDIRTETAASGSSLDSYSKESIKISWNPWKHGLSSVESLPVEDIPSTQCLPQKSNPTVSVDASKPKEETRKNFIVLNQPVDSHSISSETIEL